MIAAIIAGVQIDRLGAILDDPKLKGSVICACVMRTDGTPVFQRNEHTRAMPGSNQKLLTAAYVLGLLGSNYKPITRFWKLDDRIVVDAPGDPSITYSQLKGAANKLAAKNNLPVFVRQAYRCRIPPTWEVDDLSFRYAARPTAFCFDRGTFQVFAENGIVNLQPTGLGIKVMHFPWGPRSQTFDPNGNLLIVRGELPTARTLFATFSLSEPDKTAARVLGGPLIATEVLPSESPILSIFGDPLSKLLMDCLPSSDNFIAEHLLLMAASKQELDPYNPYPRAALQLKKFLVEKVGIASEDVRPIDGSGMSRHNLVTASAITQLLAWALKQPTAELWRSCLAKPGEGTLKSRLQGLAFQGKTGTLDTVSALSGYLVSKSGQTFIVSVIVNHYVCSDADARAVLDRFVSEIAGGNVIGTQVDVASKHEGLDPDPVSGTSHASRIRRPGRHGRALSQRARGRTQSHHAPAARTRALAVRPD